MEYFFAILAFIVVMLALLITTKYLAYKSKKMLKGNYMHIVETLSLGLNNRLHLIKVDNEFFIISATNKNVEFLARVNISEYEEEEIKNPISEVIDFKAVLKKHLTSINFGNQMKKETRKDSDSLIDQKTQGAEKMQNVEVPFKQNLEKLKHLTKSINGQRSENEQEK